MAEIHQLAQSAFYALAGALATVDVSALGGGMIGLLLGAAGGALAWRLALSYQAALSQGADPDFATAVTALRGSLVGDRWLGRDAVLAALGVALAGVCLAVHGALYGLPHVLLCMCLLWLACIDLRTGLLPDALTVPVFVLGVCLGPLAGWPALPAAGLVYGCTTGLSAAYRRLRGYDGMGGGDIKLMAALAAWVGPLALCWIVLGACLAGLAYAMVAQRRILPRGAYPFGPFLAGAAVPVLLAGTAVQSWF
ncbi:MAG: A24 family peptidase [Alcaligenaceae bacterium]|nr:A24 family peptidase [Alcaligenaceae bacterium]